MAYGLDLRLFIENGPAQRSAAQSAMLRGTSSSRVAVGLRRPLQIPANDETAADFGDGYPPAL
jgi:hypothetical protein